MAGGRNPREKWELKIDLVESLIWNEYTLPDNPIPKSKCIYWFQKHERDLGREIIEELLESDSPVETAEGGSEGIGLTSLDQGDEFVSELRDDPDWW